MKTQEMSNWVNIKRNLYQAIDGSLRAVYSHKNGSWFGLSYSTWERLKQDVNSQVHLLSPHREIILSEFVLELITPYLSQSDGHYNLNVNNDGAIKTKKGLFYVKIKD